MTAATDEPTVSAGSGRSVSVTTSEGAPEGWMSIRVPKGFPFTTKGVMPTIVPSTGAYTSVPGGAPTSSAAVDGPLPPESW